MCEVKLLCTHTENQIADALAAYDRFDLAKLKAELPGFCGHSAKFKLVSEEVRVKRS